MTPEHEMELLGLCPNLYAELAAPPPAASPLAGHGFEMGDGWFGLVRDVSVRLEEIVAGLPEAERRRARAVQCKEKMGSLRLYTDSYLDAGMRAAIDEAAELSASVCDSCGRRSGHGQCSWCLSPGVEAVRQRLQAELFAVQGYRRAPRHLHEAHFAQSARALLSGRGGRHEFVRPWGESAGGPSTLGVIVSHGNGVAYGCVRGDAAAREAWAAEVVRDPAAWAGSRRRSPVQDVLGWCGMLDPDPGARVAWLVRAIEAARCSSATDAARDPLDVARGRPEWAELTSPELAAALEAHVAGFGGQRPMNASARRFFEAAIEESARRRSSA